VEPTIYCGQTKELTFAHAIAYDRNDGIHDGSHGQRGVRYPSA
jgi:hypothetical protein